MFEPIKRAVGVVMVQERDERGGDGESLIGVDVDVVDVRGLGQARLAVLAHFDFVAFDAAFGVARRGGVGDAVILLFVGVQVDDLLGHDAVLDLGVRRLDHAEIVDARVHGQTQDQADVRAFRRVDGTEAAVVGRMDVADFEAGALAGKTAGTEGGQRAQMLDFGQGVSLIHELGKLVGGDRIP